MYIFLSYSLFPAACAEKWPQLRRCTLLSAPESGLRVNKSTVSATWFGAKRCHGEERESGGGVQLTLNDEDRLVCNQGIFCRRSLSSLSPQPGERERERERGTEVWVTHPVVPVVGDTRSFPSPIQQFVCNRAA